MIDHDIMDRNVLLCLTFWRSTHQSAKIERWPWPTDQTGPDHTKSVRSIIVPVWWGRRKLQASSQLRKPRTRDEVDSWNFISQQYSTITSWALGTLWCSSSSTLEFTAAVAVVALFRLYPFITLLTYFFVRLFLFNSVLRSCCCPWRWSKWYLGFLDKLQLPLVHCVPSKSFYPRGLDIALHERPAKHTTAPGQKVSL